MKKNISNIHLDILDKKRLELLQKLLPLTRGFILGGGTALALQLSHRISLDFDFFSSAPLPKHLLEKLSKSVEIKNIAVDTPDEATFFTQDMIKVTILYYPFKPHFKVVQAENGLLLFSIKEIAIQKAYTIGRRGEYRDYLDLYTILKNGYANLNEIITTAKKVYGNLFDEKMFLQQLVYFGDISNFEIISKPMSVLPPPKKVLHYFEELVRSYMHN